jgi:hypothetical protein
MGGTCNAPWLTAGNFILGVCYTGGYDLSIYGAMDHIVVFGCDIKRNLLGKTVQGIHKLHKTHVKSKWLIKSKLAGEFLELGKADY